MRNSIWERRMPTLLGVALIVVGVIATSALVQKKSNLFGLAASDITPKNVRFTNITDTSLTVSYLTDTPTTGVVNYGITPSFGKTVFDERDSTAKSSAYQVHSITIKNLTPASSYYLVIGSGGKAYYSTEQSTMPFIVTTNTSLKSVEPRQIHGRLEFPTSSGENEAIVYVTGNNSQTISTLSQAGGSYSLDISQLRTRDGSNFIDLQEQTSLQMYVLTPSSHSHITFLSTVGEIPTIIISEPYDFTAIPRTNSQNTATNSPQFTPLVANEGPKSNAQIIVPQQDQHFTDQQPLFKGTASPNTSLQITIHSAMQISTQTSTDSNGNWSWRPTVPLSPGNHTISITSKDQFGILRTITSSFIVYAAGSEVDQTATPSGILSATPTTSPVPTLIPSPTDSPTSVNAVTNIPTLSPPPTLITGSNSAIIGGTVAAITTIVGLLLFFAAAAL